jgi:hypothetical protein
LGHQFRRAVHGSHSASDSRYGARRQHFDKNLVGTPPHRGVEVDYLNLRERREFAQHLERCIAFERFIAALH